MDIIYQIIDSKSGLKYLGSKKKWKGHGTYFGSPNCKNKRYKKYVLQQIWKENLKNDSSTFSLEILEYHDEIEYLQLLKNEIIWQKRFDVVKSMNYINAGYAKPGYLGDTISFLTEEGKNERKLNISNGLKKKYSLFTKEEKQLKFGKNGIKILIMVITGQMNKK